MRDIQNYQATTSDTYNPRIDIRKDSSDRVEHIGAYVFHREIIDKEHRLIYDFVERYLLELYLLPTEKQRTNALQHDNVHIESELYSTMPIKSCLEDIFNTSELVTDVNILFYEKRYSVECKQNGKLLLRLVFPANHELISGYTKIEAEQILYNEMKDYNKSANYTITIDDSDLSPYKRNVYYVNDSYYSDESIRSTSYYVKKRNSTTALFDSKYLAESVYNIFNSQHDLSIRVDITQEFYGFRKETYTLNLTDMIAYFQQKGCHIYTGIKTLTADPIELIVLVVNKGLGYHHLLSVSCNSNIITNPQNSVMKVRMNCFTPIHNFVE